MQRKESKPRWLHRIARLAAWILGSMIVLYVVALCDQHYEARRAMRLYNHLLTVRLGDTVPELNRKVPDCKIDNADGEYICLVESTAQRLESHFFWYLDAQEHADEWQSVNRQKIGLRNWYLMARVTVRQARLSEMNLQFFVTGQEMMLGCLWVLTPEIPRGILDPDAATKTTINTFLGVTHINSKWAGWGYHMEFTPRSNAQDLHMREINEKCLISFTGCRTSRELLSNLPPPGHTQYW